MKEKMNELSKRRTDVEKNATFAKCLGFKIDL